ncbi:MIP/aquaporin family protein [Streptomyces purpureus]|uniref:MIP/aquaporin family protein n=1 Tax=Streptomyces purpureus TaxID=1951 RepID=UPI0037A8E415
MDNHRLPGSHRKPSRAAIGRYLPPRGRTVLLEFLITAGILFLIVTSARWIFAPDAPLGSVLRGQAAFVAMGLFFGVVNTAIIHYSMSRKTAGHMNPSVSIGLWMLRVFPGRDVLPFCVAQMTGAVAGTWLAGLVWGPTVGLPQVGYAAVAPSPGWGFWGVLAAETVAQLVCMTIVAALLIRPRWEWLIPGAVGLCITGFIAVLGPVSGGSVNPARQFGPALMSGNTGFLVAYLVGPVLGAALAAGLAAALKLPAEPGATAPGPTVPAPAGSEAWRGDGFAVTAIDPDAVCPDTIPPEMFRPDPHRPEEPYRI